MPRPLTKAQRKMASYLAFWFGDAGKRQSTADIARKLPLIDQRTPATGEIVARRMAEFVSAGWAAPSAGPRGGAGWVLSEAGAALLARVKEEDQAVLQRERDVRAAEEARKVEYLAQLDGPAGVERIAVRALTIEEAAGLAGREARRRPTGTRVRGLWEAGADLEGVDQR